MPLFMRVEYGNSVLSIARCFLTLNENEASVRMSIGLDRLIGELPHPTWAVIVTFLSGQWSRYKSITRWVFVIDIYRTIQARISRSKVVRMLIVGSALCSFRGWSVFIAASLANVVWSLLISGLRWSAELLHKKDATSRFPESEFGSLMSFLINSSYFVLHKPNTKTKNDT